MNWKIILVFTVLGATIKSAEAQNDADVLRYGMLNYGSTARSLAMGNSFGALGADFSALGVNPGGIGLYRHSEFTISPLFFNRTINSKIDNSTESYNNFKFAFGNLGVVLFGENQNRGRFKSWAFGIGYNKLNDFNSRSSSVLENSKSSLVDSYIEQVGYDGVMPQDIPNTNAYAFDIDLAWQTYLFDTITQNNQLYYFNNVVPFGGAQQSRIVKTRGGQGEWDFSFGTNYDDKLFLGATFGLNTLRYEETITWQEKDIADTIPYFKSFNIITRLKTSGSGINLKIGAIYKPNDIVRFGLAVHTPTYFTLSDEYSSTINSDLENGITYSANSPVFIPFDYNITTPFRTIGSVAFIIARNIALNFDYEFLDYNQGRLNASDKDIDASFNSINKGIQTKYTTSHNLRFGSEYRYDNLRFRIGANYNTSPFKKSIRNDKQSDLSTYGLSLGFGIKSDQVFMDIAYAYSVSGSYYQPYNLSYQDVPEITTKKFDNRVLITVGYRF